VDDIGPELVDGRRAAHGYSLVVKLHRTCCCILASRTREQRP
jgi:hypothetical protein